MISSLADGYKESQPDFLCARSEFANAMILIDLCLSVATKPTQDTPPPPPSLVSMNLKLDKIIELQLAVTASSQLHPTSPLPPSFADIAKRGAKRSSGVDKPIQRPVSLPPKIPAIVLKQTIPAAPVETKSSPEILSARINKALASACLSANHPSFKIRATSINQRSGEILIQMHSADDAAFAVESEPLWLPSINAGLRIKVKTYPIIVHGIPTSFDITRKPAVAEFQNDNPEALSSLQSITWANQASIREGKPFSSIIVHLSNPAEANFAIRNKLAFQSVLKLAEMSTRRVQQCYSCLSFGHLAARCPSKSGRCSHCAQNHRVEVCPLSDLPASCANCLDAVVVEGQKTEPLFNADSISDDDFVAISHSALSNRCPIRSRASKPSPKHSYYPDRDAE